MIFLKLSPRDPIIARDGRPFGLGVGRNVRSVPWPYPSVLAGSLRTLLGKRNGMRFGDPETIEQLKTIEVAGPIPMKDNELFLPAPQDIMFWVPRGHHSRREPSLRYLPKRPFTLKQNEGMDLPEGILPVGVVESPEEELEELGNPSYWSMERMAQWLAAETGEGFTAPPYLDSEELESKASTMIKQGFLGSPALDMRTHVKIDPSTLAAEEGMLFRTSALAMEDGIVMSTRIENAGGSSATLDHLDEFHPFGGERRLVHWRRDTDSESQWSCPEIVQQAIMGKTGIRMVLASPGLFSNGWKPAWVETGSPPGTHIRLRLIGVILNRWQPISGWSLEHRGPKEVRRLVPAGSVYFFVVERGDPQELVDKLWLRSICDNPQDRRDGFGLALWGVWNDKVFKGGV